jgi:hypothetical protein
MLNLPKRNKSIMNYDKEDPYPSLSSPASSKSARRPVTGVKAPGFLLATSEIQNRLILNIQGEEKTGKNHMAFSYTGLGDIYVHSFDQGLEGVVQKFQKSKHIYVAEYELEIQPGEASDKEVGKSANKLWGQYRANYLDSLASTRKEGLVVVDTGSESWELLRLASFGKLTQVMPHHYSKPNAEFREHVRHGYDASSVIWIHKMKDEWENYTDSQGREKGRRTGRKKYVGMNDIPFLVQCNVQTQREDLEGGGSEFTCTVLDCRINPELNGMVMPNDFDNLLAMATSI